MDIQTCPRRMQEAGPWDREEGQDSWLEEPRREGEITPLCSFCGSLHPGTLLKLVAEGWAVGPTDKTYKMYLHQIFGYEEHSSVPDGPLPPLGENVRAKFYFQHLSVPQRRQFVGLYNDGLMRFADPGHFYVLPYFMKISPSGPGRL